MDPNTCLEELRNLVRQAHALADATLEGDEPSASELWELIGGLAQHAEALDGWISSSGFLPQAWGRE